MQETDWGENDDGVPVKARCSLCPDHSLLATGSGRGLIEQEGRGQTHPQQTPAPGPDSALGRTCQGLKSNTLH